METDIHLSSWHKTLSWIYKQMCMKATVLTDEWLYVLCSGLVL